MYVQYEARFLFIYRAMARATFIAPLMVLLCSTSLFVNYLEEKLFFVFKVIVKKYKC